MTDNPAIESLQRLDLDRYYKIYTTLHQMLSDRGYSPLEPKMTKDEWVSLYIGLLSQVLDPDDDLDEFGMIDEMILLFKRNNKFLMVYFHPFDSKLAQKDMNAIHNLLNEKGAQHLIVVANHVTPKVTSVLSILGHDAQIFTENELIFNVTEHQLVPKHTKILKEEREKILETFAKMKDGKIHPDLFPGIFTTDPVVKYYNFEIDDLIRIERPRRDGYFDITYRIVTPPMVDEK